MQLIEISLSWTSILSSSCYSPSEWKIISTHLAILITDNEILKAHTVARSYSGTPDFFAPDNSTGRGVPPPPSTGSLQLLCQCFIQAQAGSTQQHCNWLVRFAHADTLASRPPAGYFESQVDYRLLWILQSWENDVENCLLYCCKPKQYTWIIQKWRIHKSG